VMRASFHAESNSDVARADQSAAARFALSRFVRSRYSASGSAAFRALCERLALGQPANAMANHTAS